MGWPEPKPDLTPARSALPDQPSFLANVLREMTQPAPGNPDASGYSSDDELRAHLAAQRESQLREFDDRRGLRQPAVTEPRKQPMADMRPAGVDQAGGLAALLRMLGIG